MQILMPEVNKDSIRNRLVKWLKKENDLVKVGDEIALIENQRVTSVIKSPYSGRLINMLQENSFINVGQPVAEVVDVLSNESPSLGINKDLETRVEKVKIEHKEEPEELVKVHRGNFLKLKIRVNVLRSTNFIRRNSITLSSYLFFCVLKSYIKYPFFGQDYSINFLELTDKGLESSFSYSDKLLKKVQIEGLRSIEEFKTEKDEVVDFSANEGLYIILCKGIELDEVELNLSSNTSVLLISAYNKAEFENEEPEDELSIFFECIFQKNLSFVLNFMKQLRDFLINPENLVI
ncbi:biotin/lipoyl attachment domain-containing protein [Thermodesulfobium narugense DSM 14796]|uniref:Biotin/lipoyl attachment domain-containing protein n=1 Tax=Thermodesulfobium narugense DSM 14796 TaxID=747365 RepID=M1E9D2_9BACT|nr:lipoyl domain-containing protein [Thermodesulfobium narugense]AEE15099.1 biotin/lipoyl attachment domain-containing protein [Thermodesulfobium narugense DSM 14796]